MMNDALNHIEPAAVWEIFAEICAIPHPSYHEKALADHLAERGRAAGMSVRRDVAGNLRIDRPGGTGPRIILQAHIDMVGQADSGKKFDFVRDPIVPVREGNWIHADGTTLGADDGVGAAMAMAALLDPGTAAARLSALFTVSEEVGLIGAGALAPEMLDGDQLVNLDGGEYFCAGCAGGVRTDLEFAAGQEAPPVGEGVEIVLSGLRGGHSGEQIDEPRGNALIFLARFLAAHPEVAAASFAGGAADNAIPREAAVLAVTPDPEKLAQAAAEFRDLLAREFDAPAEFRIEVRRAAAPEAVWSANFRSQFFALAASVANGVFARDERLGVVRTSSNLAIAKSSPGGVLVLSSSQRSMDDRERDRASEQLGAHFALLAPKVSRRGVYSGWEAPADSPLLAAAREIQRAIYPKPFEVKAIHAGLELGCFHKLSPQLELLCFGPEVHDMHSPAERVKIASVDAAYRLLRALVISAAKRG